MDTCLVTHQHRHLRQQDGYRRIEVITGELRRRQWSDEEKARIVSESVAPGANVSGVAQRHGVSVGLAVQMAAECAAGTGSSGARSFRSRWRLAGAERTMHPAPLLAVRSRSNWLAPSLVSAMGTARRHRDHGQSIRQGCPAFHPEGRSQAPVPAALLPGSQSNRAGLRQDQALDAMRPKAHHRGRLHLYRFPRRNH